MKFTENLSNGDFYASSIGFVIGGEIFFDRDMAAHFLVHDNVMEPVEAESYLNILQRIAKNARMKTERKGAVIYG